MNEEEIRAFALEYAKQNKLRIARELANTSIYLPETNPISVFMAGSPGAGKTEFSKSLIEILEKGQKRHVVRIDGDEVRQLIPGYTGDNSYLFQGAISLVVEKMHDLVLHSNQSFILDSTFSKFEKASLNIQRSLDKKRPILIFYMYQQPGIAWKFTQAREMIEGRRVSKEAFVDAFIGSYETLMRVSDELRDDDIIIYFVKKNFEKNSVENIIEITKGQEQIDRYIGKVYTKDELESLL
ncbi:MAG: zeta toxin family protein [Patescibacteria group bacterium]